MISRFVSHVRHLDFYPQLIGQAANLFANERTQINGPHIVDENQEQVDVTFMLDNLTKIKKSLTRIISLYFSKED